MCVFLVGTSMCLTMAVFISMGEVETDGIFVICYCVLSGYLCELLNSSFGRQFCFFRCVNFA